MSRLIIAILIVMFALTVLGIVMYRYFAAREETKREEKRLRHERDMKEQELLFDDNE